MLWICSYLHLSYARQERLRDPSWEGCFLTQFTVLHSNFVLHAVHSKYIYCVCTCITVYTCTCAPASTCTPVSTYTFCSDLVTFFHILLRSCNFFSHLHRTFCSLHRILPLFRTCKNFLTQIFKCPNKKKRVFTFCYFSTFVQNLFFYFLHFVQILQFSNLSILANKPCFTNLHFTQD